MKKEFSEILNSRNIPFLILGVISFALCCLTQWHSDASFYQYIVPLDPDALPDKRIESIKDIFISQANHYYSTNGRFFVHFIVQFFCGITGKYLFAVFNAAVWFLLPAACMRLAVCSFRLSRDSIAVSCLIFFLLIFLRFDPAFQINYAWLALMMCVWALIFFDGERNYRWPALTLIAVFSFLFGEGNESFSIPIGGAIIFYAFTVRFRLTSAQWVSAIAFGLGSIILIAAPGNWVRLDSVNANTPGLTNLASVLPGLIFPAVYLLSLLIKREDERSSERRHFRQFLLVVAVINYLFCLGLGGGSGFRMLIPGNLCFVMLSLPRLLNWRYLKAFNIFACVAALLTLCPLVSDIIRQKNADNAIYDGYSRSTDGIVYLPDSLFIYRAYQFIDSYSTYQAEANHLSPGKPILRVRPETMKYLPLGKDTNMLVRLSDNAWLIMQSKSEPADFTVKKWWLPGILDRRVSDRHLDFSRKYDITFDSVENSRFAIYINTRPFLMKAEVEMGSESTPFDSSM